MDDPLRHLIEAGKNDLEMAKLRAALETAMTTLEQIATTPRNAGAKRNASATLTFLRTQMEAKVHVNVTL